MPKAVSKPATTRQAIQQPPAGDTDRLLAAQVDAVRRFSRFYTRTIGVLHESFLGSALSLTEGRVLYELGQGPAVASGLAEALDLDPGYLSRILKAFESRDLLRRSPSSEDGRQQIVSLSVKGRKLFHAIDRRSAEEVAALLAPMSGDARGRLARAMREIEEIVAPRSAPRAYWLRDPKPGDIGRIVSRHGALYAQEYGFDWTFEALVAEVAAAFVRNFAPGRERCWIAETDEGVAGSVFVVRQSDEVAKLRLLYVEPSARGLGIGRRLVDEAIAFARGAGYRGITLWTNDCLDAARHIYERAGFVRVAQEPHRSFGCDLVGETWELQLSVTAPTRTRRIRN